MPQVTDRKLQLYLRKCESQWRPEHTDGLDSVDWLAPYCNSVEGIVAYLRELGFRLRVIAPAAEDSGGKGWVVTTSGVIVYVNDEYCHGAFAKEVKF